MPVRLLMPKIGLNMVEGQITEWNVKEGAAVRKGEVLYVVETEKVTNDVQSPADGMLVKILVSEQEVVPVREVVGILAEPNEKIDLPKILKEIHGDQNQKEEQEQHPGKNNQPTRAVDGSKGSTILASPLAKRLAANNNIVLSDIKGSGPSGRINVQDIESFIEEKAEKKDKDSQLENIVPLSGVRKIVAERMALSAATIPMVTLNSELDVTNLVAYREAIKKTNMEKTAIPSYNALLGFLIARALIEFPFMNASFQESGIRFMKDVNLGFAVDTSEGLMVVVVRKTNQKSVDQIHGELREMTERAQDRKSAPEDLLGSTFTITNLGMYGVDSFNPIINPPEAAILGVCRFIEKDILLDGKNRSRHMANFSLTFDHRVIDGAPAARFLQKLGEFISAYK